MSEIRKLTNGELDMVSGGKDRESVGTGWLRFLTGGLIGTLIGSAIGGAVGEPSGHDQA